MTTVLLEWVFTSIFLILTVLALRAAFGRRVSARLRYVLWAVVLVRLLVPVQLFTSPIAGTWVLTEKHTERNIDRAPDEGLELGGPEDILTLGAQDGPSAGLTTFPEAPSAPALPDAPEPPAAPDLTRAPAWLGWVWLAGSAAVFLVLLLSNLRFFWKLSRERILLDGVDCPVRVYAAAGLPSPCLFGVLRPAIYVTPEAAEDPNMLRHVLAHEYTHYRHGDHIWSLLRCAALAIHWWNPLVWLAAVLSRRDAELACDEGALKRLGDAERAGYGSTLLALVTAKPGPVDLFRCATTMTGDMKSLKERISRIACTPKRWLWAAVAAVLATVLACACAFGQAAEEPAEDPPEDPVPAASQDVEVEIAFSHTGNDLTSSFYVPEDILDAAERWVAGQFAWDAPGGVMIACWNEYNPETDEWETKGNPDIRAEFDRVRISGMMGPWGYEKWNTQYSIWRVNYEYHTLEPEAVRDGNFLFMSGGMYLTDDGWLCPTYPNSTYLIFRINADGTGYTFAGSAMINDCDPDDDSGQLSEAVAAVLDPEPVRDPLPDDAFEHPRTWVFIEPDLNRNGIKETVKEADIVDDEGSVLGKRIGVFENDELIWWDEGYNAHAGYNAIFLCTLNNQDYLLRYNPVMYQGIANYTYKLFTLENGVETVAEEAGVDFDIHVDSPNFTGQFNPEDIFTFVNKVNHLLYYSQVLMVTDEYLIDGINKDGLVENLWWLDNWAPVFVRDEYKTLYGNLCAYLAAMEPYNIPTVRALDEYHTQLQLSYHGMRKEFDGIWDEAYQPNPDCKAVDLNEDGKDEIVVILNAGHGTGACTFDLYLFDAETLEQYDTSALTQDIIDQIERTGDEDNFYLSGLGMEKVAIARSIFGDVLWLADAIDMGNIVYYTLEENGKITCTIGCDASGTANLYCGSLYVELAFDGSGFRVTGCTYVQDPEYGGE